ncbi:terminase small subunit [Enterobacter hormaechei]|uniref:terminase small subunit n=1 Tax=Enterobacter hormaechei TaxID=158836 RepID=UPI0021C78F82|nr:terminase small subunit [Enterobacter hormaechei]
MAKPDWGELQQRFLSEHAATGVSPKEWCEAQGLNYATARRYIKKTSAQKPAQKKMRTAQKDKSANELVDDDGLTAQQCLFVAEYLKDNNATAAAARAGYSDPNYGRQLITNPNVAQAIAHQQKASIARTLGGADEVLAQIWQLATFDANQLSQYRRGACRYCWGFGHQYQWRDMVEFEEKRLEALERKSREPVDVGGYGYDHTREANPGWVLHCEGLPHRETGILNHHGYHFLIWQTTTSPGFDQNTGRLLLPGGNTGTFAKGLRP